MHTITKFENGMRIISEEMPAMESVAIGLWIGTGGRYETKELNGISHFLEHLLFRGTARRSALQISRAIESVGGSINAFTAEEYTCYVAKVPHAHLQLAADVIFDICFSPALREEDIEKEKGVVREEINMYLDTPSQHVMDLFNTVLWGDHPLGRPLAGTPESVAAFARGEIASYHGRQYSPRGMVLAAVGKLNHAELIAAVKKLAPGRRNPLPHKFSPARNLQRQPAFLLHRKNTEQTHLCVGVRGYHRRHPDRYALQLLSIILGENMSSRLFQKVREKHGLAYAIHSGVHRYMDTGAFSVYAGVEHAKFLAALSMILSELARISEDGVSARELGRAKEYWRGQLLMGLEKTMQTMLYLGETMLCTGRVLTKEEFLSKIMEVKLDDVQRVAGDIFADRKLNLACIGPLSEPEEEIREALRIPADK